MSKIDFEIKNQNSAYAKDLNTLKERSRVELEKLNQQQKDQTNLIKEDQEQQKIQITNETEKKKAEELQRREVQLNDIKASVEKTKKTLNTEKNDLETAHKFQIHQKKDHQRVENQAFTDQQNYHIKEVNNSYNKKLGQIHQTGEGAIRSENENQRIQYKKIQSEGHHQINSESERFTELYRLSEKRHKDQIDHLEFMQNLEAQEKENLHKIKLNQKQKHFDEEIFKQDKDQKQLLVDSKNEFDIKYNNIQKQFEDNLKLLGNKVDQSLGQLKLGLSEQIDLQQARGQDSFYSLPTLDPIISEREKDYVVKIAVNEIDKGFINIAVQDKYIDISFNRSFEDKIPHENEGESRISRAETFKKREKVDHFLNGKKVEKQYQNGVMTYIIPKKV